MAADTGEKISDIDLKELSNAIDDVMAGLNEKERNIITLRFGIHGERPHTLEEIGKMYHVTRERVRQIETKAIRRLRLLARRKHLNDFLIK